MIRKAQQLSIIRQVYESCGNINHYNFHEDKKSLN